MRDAEVLGRANELALPVLRDQLETIGQRHGEGGDQRLMHDVGHRAPVAGGGCGGNIDPDEGHVNLLEGCRADRGDGINVGVDDKSDKRYDFLQSFSISN